MRRSVLPFVVVSLIAGCAARHESPLVPTPRASAELTAKTGLVVAEEGTPTCTKVYRASFRNAILEVRPGETMCWELPEDDRAMDPLAIDPSAADARRTIVVRMWQDDGARNTFLTFHNPFGHAMKYRTTMMRPESEDFVPTTSCAVGGGRFTIEQWPQTLMAIRIADAVFVDGDDLRACD